MAHDYIDLADRLERAFSPRIALRRISLSDGWPLFEATRNPLFNRFLMWDPPANEDEVLARVDAIVDAARRGRLAALSGVVRTTGEWASLFRFQPYGADPEVMEMGVWTHPRFWQGRYTLELSRMCVDACFAASEADRLIGAAAPDNAGSCQLMRAVGMREIDLVTRRTESGRRVELQEFEILRSVWQDMAPGRLESPSHRCVPTAAQAAEARREVTEALHHAARDDADAAVDVTE